MADRTVRVVLDAVVAPYTQSLRRAAAETRDFAAQTRRHTEQHRRDWDTAGTAVTAAGAAIAFGVARAVTSFADFDQGMSAAAAATRATGQELANLRDLAVQAGAATQYSATEAAAGITELAKAGVSTADILGGGLYGALDLAAAGQLSVADASNIAGVALQQFGLRGRDLPHVADLLAAGAGKAVGSVQDLGTALAYVGPVAASMGVSVEESVGVLAEFAAAGLEGEKGGTAFRGMLGSLLSPSRAAAKTMDDLGINLYDAQGQFIGMSGAAQVLQDRLGPLDQATRNQALGQIFGNAQLAAATVLYQGGGKAVDEWTTAVNDAGFAQEQARRLTDNWRGDLERLGGSIDTVLIQSGSAANDTLRSLTQAAEAAVNWFGDLPQPVQSGALALGAVAAAAGLAGGGLLLVVPRVAETVTAFRELRTVLAGSNISLGRVGSYLTGPWGVAIAAGTVVIGGLVDMQRRAAQQTREFRDALDQQTGALTERNRELVATSLEERGLLQRAEAIGVNTQLLTDAVLGNASALRQLRDEQSRSEAAARAYITAQDDQVAAELRVTQGITVAGDAQNNAAVADYKRASSLRALLPGLADAAKENLAQVDAVKRVAGASEQAGEATSKFGNDLGTYAGRVQEAAAETEDLARAVAGIGDAFLTARGKARDYQAALDDATEALKENGRTLNIGTDAGRKNQAALDGIAEAALASAAANLENGDSVEEVAAQVDKARRDFIRMAEKMDMSKKSAADLATQAGLTGDNIEDLAEDINGIPAEKNTTITADTTQARTALQVLQDRLAALRNKTIRVTTIETRQRAGIGGKADPYYQGYAAGGIVHGPGTATSDSVPAWLSAGEYVVKAAAVDRYGPAMLDAINGLRFASGGPVPRAFPPVTVSTSFTAHRAATAAAGVRAAPLVQVGTINTHDDRAAFRELRNEMQDAVNLFGVAAIAAGA